MTYRPVPRYGPRKLERPQPGFVWRRMMRNLLPTTMKPIDFETLMGVSHQGQSEVDWCERAISDAIASGALSGIRRPTQQTLEDGDACSARFMGLDEFEQRINRQTSVSAERLRRFLRLASEKDASLEDCRSFRRQNPEFPLQPAPLCDVASQPRKEPSKEPACCGFGPPSNRQEFPLATLGRFEVPDRIRRSWLILSVVGLAIATVAAAGAVASRSPKAIRSGSDR